ncbi:ABC transporter permease [Ruminococcaceae bacterium OttesenSCG-928-O06]|nr:ABC transporter permease [Ruminococcaceae bacterium OttesenSCG-928-O06]
MRKNILREIRSTMGRFIAIFAISALGAGFFAGLKATGPDMRATADLYYQEQNLMDVRLLSTYGFTGADADALAARDDVKAVMAGYGLDLLVHNPEGDEVARFAALPAAGTEGDADMNRIVLVEGRLPDAADECVVDAQTAYQVGDVINLSEGNDEDTLDMLNARAFTVVGRANAPSYIAFTRGSTNIGNGRIAFFVYTTAAAFDGEYYSEIFLRLEGTEKLSSFSDEYETLVDDAVESLEGFGEVRAEVRYTEIVDEANEELADARAELDDAKAEADEKLGDALREIEDAERKIADGWAEVAENAQKLEDAKRDIASGQAALDDARASLAAGQSTYDAGWAEYQQNLGAWQQNKAAADALQAGLGTPMDDAFAALDATTGSGMIEPPTPEAEAGFDAAAEGVVQLAEGAAALLEASGDAGAAAAAGAIRGSVDAACTAIDEDRRLDAYTALGALAPGGALHTAMAAAAQGAQDELAAALPLLQDAEAKLLAARAQLDEGWAGVSAAESQLTSARAEVADGEVQLADARRELADAQVELADGRQEYEEEKAKAEAEIADAEEKLADAQKELDELEAPKWYVRTRQDNPGYSGFASDADRINALAAAIPVFFFLVAVLVCLTTMTRMVEEQRSMIGTLKALGYTRWAIAAKYLLYAGFASVTGAVVGVIIGFIAFPTAIWQAYGMMYVMPSIHLGGNTGLAVLSVAVCVACTTLAALFACLSALRSVPAELMRPKAPRAGKRVILERIGPLWRRMSFMQKVTARNLLRYKKRFFMTVVGVAGCTALLLTGFGLRDSITGIVARQYGGINRYDLVVATSEATGAAENTELNRLWPQYAEGIYTQETLIDAESESAASGGMTVYLYVMEQPQEFDEFIRLWDRKGGTAVAPPGSEGAVITEKLADRLKLKVGDTLWVNRVNEDARALTVQGVAENYIFNYVFVSPAQYEALFGEVPEYDTLLLNLHEDQTQNADAILEELLNASPVAGAVDIASYQDQFDDMFSSLNAVVWLIIGAAALLAFVVLYNLTNINITERYREIATLKVLGFFNGEVASYVYRENLILTLIGIVLGLVLGVFLHDFVITTAEVDEVMFRRVIELLSYVWSVLFTLLCAGLVNLAMLRRLRRIDMVESLKSAE